MSAEALGIAGNLVLPAIAEWKAAMITTTTTTSTAVAADSEHHKQRKTLERGRVFLSIWLVKPFGLILAATRL